MTLSSRTRRAAMAIALAAGTMVVLAGPQPAAAITVPAGFQEQVVFSGLSQPTSIRFSPDGRVFIGQKDGVIRVYDNLADTTPTTFANLSPLVHNMWDRGLLGMALAPNFPADPYVYVLYTYDAPLGQTAPLYNDNCNVVPGGANGGNCVVSGRLSRLQASGNQMIGTEQVLISDWCQQYPSHSIGEIQFGPDGALYVSGGDGASFSAVDYGQFGSPVNPCGDPANEGGALRSQDIRATADPTSLDGDILRLDPVTGAALPSNPLFSSTDANTRRIIAHGLRNPFRFTFRPGTSELWIGDVGWGTWEEINRIVNPTAGVTNFGWPCYEGAAQQNGYRDANLALCNSLYTGAGQTTPYFASRHGSPTMPGDPCTLSGGSSISGLAFYPTSGGSYPASYNGALFFSDYSRRCIYAMLRGTNGLPDPAQIIAFGAQASEPVYLQMGPGGELYYADLGGTVRRIRYFPGNQPPVASISANPTSGSNPLTVAFNGAGSTDADPADQGRLTYAWDFTNDGTTDATGPTASFTYTAAGNYTARLTVADTLGATGTTTVSISAGNSAPTAIIDSPTSALNWAVGNTISFSGRATDPQQGTLPASALTWEVLLEHCVTAGNCHTHPLQTFTGVASGSFIAPDHEYPAYLRLRLTATDSGGLTSVSTVDLQPRTVNLSFATNPTGLSLTVGGTSQTAPFTRTVIVGSVNTISAPSPQGGRTFSNWSDGGAQTHAVTAPATATSYTATYSTTTTCADSFGYTCTAGPRGFIPASTATALAGDTGAVRVNLPFPFTFYGTSYSQVYIDNNGMLSFAVPGSTSWINQAIPATGAPNAGIYAFWDDLVVSSGGSIRTQAFGTAPNRYWVVEWRDVYVYAQPQRLFSVNAVLYENGSIGFAYTGDMGIAANQGGSATVGIENAAGTVALRYLYNSASLRSGDGLLIVPPSTAPPAIGTLTGVVTDGGTPVSGASVVVSPGGARTTTGADGRYTLVGLPAGNVTVSASKPADRCAGRSGSTTATVTAQTTTTANVAFTVGGSRDAFGYTCAAAPRAFLPADQPLALTGDDASITITTPFPIKLYEQTGSTLWVDTDGFVTLGQGVADDWINGPIPQTRRPNAAVYGFWDDLVVDGASQVLTRTNGAAPNRSFVVEFRNVYVYDFTERFSFQIVLYENGEIALAYSGGMTTAVNQGNSATVGIENGDGTVGIQYSSNAAVLRSGDGILFRPPAP